jgi:hypothetical protein
MVTDLVLLPQCIGSSRTPVDASKTLAALPRPEKSAWPTVAGTSTLPPSTDGVPTAACGSHSSTVHSGGRTRVAHCSAPSRVP